VPDNPYVVTVAALYGAGGTVIAPRVAEALGVPFLDRQIPEAMALESGRPLGQAVHGSAGSGSQRRGVAVATAWLRDGKGSDLD
jgi:hypothetical protein